jgi:sugar lactone lactonase YvrE
MFDGRILSIDLSGVVDVVGLSDDRPGGLGFLPDGSLLAVQMRSRTILRYAGGAPNVYADLTSFPADHLNDMIVGGSGVAYVGLRHAPTWSSDAADADSIVAVQPGGEVELAAANLRRPNGMAITGDGKTLIVAETAGRRLTAFEIAADGTLANRRVFADTGDFEPDGICLDVDGAVWFGAPLSKRFIRMLPGGRIDVQIPVEGWAVSCVLGGEDRRTLCLATALVPADERLSLEKRLGKAAGVIELSTVRSAGSGRP